MKKIVRIIFFVLVAISGSAQEVDSEMTLNESKWSIGIAGFPTYSFPTFPSLTHGWERSGGVRGGLELVLAYEKVLSNKYSLSLRSGISYDVLQYKYSIDQYAGNLFLYTQQDYYDYSLINIPISFMVKYEKRISVGLSSGLQFSLLTNHQYTSLRSHKYEAKFFDSGEFLIFFKTTLFLSYKINKKFRIIFEPTLNNAIKPLNYYYENPSIGERGIITNYLKYLKFPVGIKYKL